MRTDASTRPHTCTCTCIFACVLPLPFLSVPPLQPDPLRTPPPNPFVGAQLSSLPITSLHTLSTFPPPTYLRVPRFSIYGQPGSWVWPDDPRPATPAMSTPSILPPLPTSQGFEPWTAQWLAIQAQVSSPPSTPTLYLPTRHPALQPQCCDTRLTAATQGGHPHPGPVSSDWDGGLKTGQLSPSHCCAQLHVGAGAYMRILFMHSRNHLGPNCGRSCNKNPGRVRIRRVIHTCGLEPYCRYATTEAGRASCQERRYPVDDFMPGLFGSDSRTGGSLGAT